MNGNGNEPTAKMFKFFPLFYRKLKKKIVEEEEKMI